MDPAWIAATIAVLSLALNLYVTWRGSRDRLLEVRAGLYADLWVACDKHAQQVSAQFQWQLHKAPGATNDPPVGSTEEARRALMAVELISPAKVEKAAKRLYDATVDLGAGFSYDAQAKFPKPVDQGAWGQAVTAWTAAADAFQAIAAKDVGKPK